MYDKYVDKIYNFVYYRTHHKETAEDLTSLIFIKALENISNYKKGTNFNAWIYRIARNTIIDHYRTKREFKDIDDIWDLASSDDLSSKIDNKETLKKIEKYLNTLKSLQRDVIIMRIWDNLSFKEISKILNKSEGSLKMMLSRSRKELKENYLTILILLISIKHG